METQQSGSSEVFEYKNGVSTLVKEKLTIPQVIGHPGLRLVRERYAKKSVKDYLETLQEPARSQFLRLHEEHPFYTQVCAGAKHHHWWLGGLQTHVCEMIGYALDLLALYPGDFEGKVTRDDIIIACYLHDFAKVWAYDFIADEDREKNPKKYHPEQLFRSVNGPFDIVDQESKTLLELARLGVKVSEVQWSAVLFAEGGYADANFCISGLTRTSDTVMARNPLAVIAHMADMFSSQILGGSLV